VSQPEPSELADAQVVDQLEQLVQALRAGELDGDEAAALAQRGASLAADAAAALERRARIAARDDIAQDTLL